MVTFRHCLRFFLVHRFERRSNLSESDFVHFKSHSHTQTNLVYMVVRVQTSPYSIKLDLSEGLLLTVAHHGFYSITKIETDDTKKKQGKERESTVLTFSCHTLPTKDQSSRCSGIWGTGWGTPAGSTRGRDHRLPLLDANTSLAILWRAGTSFALTHSCFTPGQKSGSLACGCVRAEVRGCVRLCSHYSTPPGRHGNVSSVCWVGRVNIRGFPLASLVLRRSDLQT